MLPCLNEISEPLFQLFLSLSISIQNKIFNF